MFVVVEGGYTSHNLAVAVVCNPADSLAVVVELVLRLVEYAENVVVERTYPIGVAFVEPLGQVDKFALELLVRNLAQGVLIVAHIV